MSITVTMLQTRQGEGGVMWNSGSSYSASDEFGTYLITSNLATGTVPLPPPSSFTAENIKALVSGAQNVVDSQTAATANAANIQAALNRGGQVNVIDAGVVWINAKLVINSNTRLFVGPNTTIKLADGIQDVMVETYASANGIDRSVTGITSSGTMATVNIAAHGRAVNDWVCIGGSTSGGYNGCFQVESVTDANNYTLRLLLVPTATTALGTIVERAATSNIAITGPGYWDGNKANKTALGSKRDMGFMLTYCANVTIDIRARNFIHRVIGPGYTNGLRGPGLIYENSIGGLINGGPVSNYDIDLVQGNSSVDDIFALQGSDYAAYAIGGPGDCLRCKVGIIRGVVTSVGNAIKITGAAGFTQELEVGLIEAECQVSDLVQIVHDSAVVGAGTDVRSLTIGMIRHINPVHNSAAIKVARDAGTPVLNNLVIGGVNIKVAAGVTYSLVSPNNANCSIGRTKLSNVDIEGAAANQLIYVFNQIGAITEVQVSGLRMKNGGSVFVHDSAGSESGQRVQLDNVFLTGCGSLISFRRSLTVLANNVKMETIGTAAISSGSAATLTLVGEINVDATNKYTNLAGSARLTPFSNTFQAAGDFVTAALNAKFWNTDTAWASGSGTDKSGFYGYTGAAWAKIFGPA